MIKKKFLFTHLSVGGGLRSLLKSAPAIVLSVLIAAVVVYAWTEPSVAPPGGNVAAPINVGSTAQSKVGNLGIGGFGSFGSPGKLDVVSAAGGTSIRLTDNTNSTLTISHPAGGKVSFANGGGTTWLTESGGNVGVGTASPAAKLSVNGPGFNVYSTDVWVENNMHVQGNEGLVPGGRGRLRVGTAWGYTGIYAETSSLGANNDLVLGASSGVVRVGPAGGGQSLYFMNFRMTPISATELGMYDSGGNQIVIFDQGV